MKMLLTAQKGEATKEKTRLGGPSEAVLAAEEEKEKEVARTTAVDLRAVSADGSGSSAHAI